MANTFYCTNVVQAPRADEAPWCGQPVISSDYGIEHHPSVNTDCDNPHNFELTFRDVMSVSLLTRIQADNLLEENETLRPAQRDGHDVYIAVTPDGEERTLCYAYAEGSCPP